MDVDVSWPRRLWKAIWGEGTNPVTGDWYPSMLTSRKFRQLLFVDFVVLAFAFVLVAVYGVRESEVAVKALDTLGTVTVAYFALNVANNALERRWPGSGRGTPPRRENEEDENV